jgi:hypothetical protein
MPSTVVILYYIIFLFLYAGISYWPIVFFIIHSDLPLNITGAKIVLFVDDTNILVSGDNVTKLQYKISNVLDESQTWFELKNLVVNAEEARAMSFHNLQSKKPMSPHIFEGRDIQYKM